MCDMCEQLCSEKLLEKNGSTKTFIAKRYKTSLPNFYKWMKKQGILLKLENQ